MRGTPLCVVTVSLRRAVEEVLRRALRSSAASRSRLAPVPKLSVMKPMSTLT